MSAENKELIRRLFDEALNKHNPAAADPFVAANYVGHLGGQEVSGLDGWKQFISGYFTAFPDAHYTVEEMVAEGDRVVTRWTGRGTHKGDLMGIAPTGRQVTVPGMGVSRIAGGKVVEEWEFWDALGMFQQLGVIPTPAQATT